MKYIVGVLLLLVAGCVTKPVRKANEITKVELGRSGAWSDFGGTVSIDSALNYQYFGDLNYVKQGYFTGKAGIALWDTLNKKLERINYKKLDTADFAGCMDCEYYEMIIHWRNKTKRILRVDHDGKPDLALDVFKWLDTSYKKVTLKRMGHALKFETKIHYPPPTPPIHMVKFPPPAKQKS